MLHKVQTTGSNAYLAVTIATGLMLFLPASLMLVAGSPRIWAPYPMVLVLPAFDFGALVFAFPTFGFWAAELGLLRCDGRTPRWFVIVFLVVGLLHLGWLALAWDYGMRWQGPAHTITVSVASVGGHLLALAWLLISRRKASPALHLLGRWSAWLWLTWLSFPYLGETP